MFVRRTTAAVAVICCLVPIFSSLTVEIDVSERGQSEYDTVDGDILNGQCGLRRHALKPPCNVSLYNFNTAATAFTNCLMSSIKPACFCEVCYNAHNLLQLAYSGIKNSTECTEKLLTSDRVNAIEEMYNFVTAIWTTRGRCEECFNPHSHDLSQRSTYFYQYLKSLDECIKNCTTHNGSVCEDCGANYTKLKDYYDNSFGHDPTRVCIDISDHMNTSVREWRNNKCHGTTSQVTVAVLAAVAVVILSAVFYVSVYCYGVRQGMRWSPSSSRETTPDRREKVPPLRDPSLDVTSDMSSLN